MISIEVNSEPDSNWNKRLLDSSLGTIHQTDEFGKFAEIQNQTPSFLIFKNPKGVIVGQLILTEFFRKYKKNLAGRILQKISKKKLCRWNYGPIIFDSNFSNDICLAFKKFLISKKCKVIGSELPLRGGSFKCLEKPFQIKPWSTFLIDLSEDLEILLKNTDKHSVQKNIKRSEKKGVSIREMSDRDLPMYFDILIKNKAEKNSDPNFFIFEKTWQILHKIGFTGFIAYQNDIPVGGIMVSSFNGYINEFNIARTKRDTEEKLYSQDLLKWKIIQWGKQNNLNYYDLTGANPNPRNQKELGIFRYKKKWGGKPITYNLFEW